jgi:hypothetical protein
MLAAGRLARLRRVAGVQRWRRDWIGLDVGGERSATAVVWVNEHLPVGAAICHGDPGVLEGVDHVRALARHASEAIARHGRLEAERRASQDAIS